MNNEFEKQDLPEQEEEFSTIFADPTEHEKRADEKKSKKKLWVPLVLLLVVALIAVSVFVAPKYISFLLPESCAISQEEEFVDNEIKILDYDAGDMKTATITNKNGTFEFYSETTKSLDEESGEEYTEIKWYLKGLDKSFVNSDLINSIVEKVVDFDAVREIKGKSDKECGFDNPQATANIVSKDGKEFTVVLGADSLDNTGVYAKVSGDEKVYIISGVVCEKLTFTDLDLASNAPQEGIVLADKYSAYYSGGVLASFDTLTVSGNYFKQNLVFERNSDTLVNSFVPYVVVSPMERTAENVDGIFSVLSDGYPVEGAYAYDVKPQTLKKFGLNSPDFQISGKFKDFTYSYKFKQQKDGYFAVVGTDSKLVQKVSASDCTFLYYRRNDFYSKTVFMAAIDDVLNLTLEFDGKSYSFDITKNPSGSEELNKYIVESGGKTFNSSYFQSYYQFLCLLEIMDFEVEDVSGSPDMVISYTYNKGNMKSTKIEFYKLNATKYQCSVDGVMMGKISSSSYNKISKNLQRLLDGKQIIVN